MAVYSKELILNITADNDYDVTTTLCGHGTMTVEGSATVIPGFRSPLGVFTAFDGGVPVTNAGAVIDHGIGKKLMVAVTGLGGPITVSYTPGC